MSPQPTYKRIAIVTGTTSGIGEAVAKRFIADGYAVVGNGRTESKLFAQENAMGSAFVGVVGDAAEQTTIDRLFAAAVTRFGRPADIVIANAGRGLGGSVTTSDVNEFEEVVRTNVVGAMRLLQTAGKKFVEQQAGVFPKAAADILVIGSVVGRHISPFSAAYGATKFAANSMAEALRREIASKGVRVTLVEPAIVVSGFQDVAGYSDEMVQGFHERFGPLLAPEDIANAIAFVVSQPPHVHISDILVRPTRQEYP